MHPRARRGLGFGDDEHRRLEQRHRLGRDDAVADGLGHDGARPCDLADVCGAQSPRVEGLSHAGECGTQGESVGERELHGAGG